MTSRENVVSAVMGMYTPQMATQAGGQNMLAFMWPILANYARQNFNLGKVALPQQGTTTSMMGDLVKLFEIFSDFYNGSVEDRIQRIVHDLKPEPASLSD